MPQQQLSFVTLDVFTTERYAGNPLAVVRVPAGEDVSTEQMQKIAREFNLSETIFLHDAELGADGLQEWRVRIFLTSAEIPFAGHPTIGAAVYALSSLSVDKSLNLQRGRLIANAGPMELNYDRTTGIARAAIAHNFHEHTQYPFTVEDVCTLQPSLKHITLSQKHITIVSPVKGMNFIAVELPSLEALASIGVSTKPTPKLDDDWNTGFSGSYYYVYTSAPVQKGETEQQIQIQSRMIEGLFEDPATGSAACAFACYAALMRKSSSSTTTTTTTQFSITQGVEMGRKSVIAVEVTLTSDRKSVEKVILGGSAVAVMEGSVQY